ncbi:MAG: hypothetical protein GY838_13630 [bacterium]|nr:hypothetical protein [bacterium]
MSNNELEGLLGGPDATEVSGLSDAIDADPGMDMLDETAVEKIREDGLEGLAPGEEVIESIFHKLSPDQKAAALTSLNLASTTNHNYRDPMFIDPKTAPPEIHLHWLGPGVVEGFGTRGYAPVRRTPETLKWVPNCPAFGTKPYITHGRMVLGWITQREYLIRISQEFQSMSAHQTKMDDMTRSAVENVHRKLGVSTEEARRLDQGSATGVTLTRGGDPGSPARRDVVDADQAAAALRGPATEVETSADRGGTKRRVKRGH